MKNTTIAFTCSLAGTLALLVVNGDHAVQGLGGQHRSVEAMLKPESGHYRFVRAPVAAPPRAQVAYVASTESAQPVAIAWVRDRR